MKIYWWWGLIVEGCESLCQNWRSQRVEREWISHFEGDNEGIALSIVEENLGDILARNWARSGRVAGRTLCEKLGDKLSQNMSEILARNLARSGRRNERSLDDWCVSFNRRSANEMLWIYVVRYFIIFAFFYKTSKWKVYFDLL